jgi:tripartite-type tricarboxylate transporter receptor subunit TctC
MKLMNWAVAALATALAVGSSARAQDRAQDQYPARLLTVVVPLTPGTTIDILARLFAESLSKRFGQQVIVANRPGAGGLIAAQAVAAAPADGYTVLLANSGHAILGTLNKNLPFDPVGDFAGVSLIGDAPTLVNVAPSLGVRSLQDFIALAKAKPGTINYGSTGPGSMPHLAGELLRISAKIDVVHVPYRGAAPAINDLVGHQVQIMFLDVPVLLPQIQAGAIKALAVGGKLRVASLPDLPTMAELGYPQIEADNWYGLVAPAKTPRPIIAKLNAAAVAAMKTAEVREKLAPQGAILVGDSPEEFTEYIRSEIAKWAKVVQAAGIKVN